jgi:hypothetical protein
VGRESFLFLLFRDGTAARGSNSSGVVVVAAAAAVKGHVAGETETHDKFEFAATLLAGKEFEQ